MAQFKRHLFICVNERDADDPRGACTARGGVEVAKAFKKGIHERGLKRVIRANKAGCLDQCAHGPVCVVYPEAIWYGQVSLEDVDEIIDEHLVAGRPVERLQLRPDQLTGIEESLE